MDKKADRESSPPPYYGAVYADHPQSDPLLVPMRSPVDSPTVIAIGGQQRPLTDQNVSYDNCHLVWSVISIFVCHVLGVVATVMAILGYTDHRTGNYVGYKRKRRCAIGFLVTSLLLGVLVIGGYVVCRIYHPEQGVSYWLDSEEDNALH